MDFYIIFDMEKIKERFGSIGHLGTQYSMSPNYIREYYNNRFAPANKSRKLDIFKKMRDDGYIRFSDKPE
ncbi:hypothetical protein [Helicobacter felis]|uniref:hypothetical protein n=1 Tax=Helicobacter felis TaxID=214 RepID=UPI000CEEA361|nr:hypothetical protein [Helicobacter felis]